MSATYYLIVRGSDRSSNILYRNGAPVIHQTKAQADEEARQLHLAHLHDGLMFHAKSFHNLSMRLREQTRCPRTTPQT